jgi:hypothetical protein
MQAAAHGPDEILARGELSEGILQLTLALMLEKLDFRVVDACQVVYPGAPAGKVRESREEGACGLILSDCREP